MEAKKLMMRAETKETLWLPLLTQLRSDIATGNPIIVSSGEKIKVVVNRKPSHLIIVKTIPNGNVVITANTDIENAELF